jgi:hypothetical protein
LLQFLSNFEEHICSFPLPTCLSLTAAFSVTSSRSHRPLWICIQICL